jgi:hypothetical protein
MKKLMIAFLFIAFYAFYLFFTKLLFGDDNLICIHGKLPKYDKLLKTTTIKTKDTELASLVFKMDRDSRSYTSKVDIKGIENGKDIFNGVIFSIARAGEIEVYIRKQKLQPFLLKFIKLRLMEKKFLISLKNPLTTAICISCCFFLLCYSALLITGCNA